MQHTATHPRITVVAKQSVFKKSVFIFALAGIGGITVLSGILNSISAGLLISNAALPALSHAMLIDALIDVVNGGLLIASSRAFSRGKILAIWLYGSSILLDTLYSLIMKYPLHYISIALAGLLIWQMLKFRKEWEAL